MTVVNRILSDLRDKRLWPLALVLLLALIAVPVLLSKGSSSATPVAQLPATGSSSAPPSGLPVVSTSTGPAAGAPIGRARDPFTQLFRARVAAATAGTQGSTISSSLSSGTSAVSSGSSSTTGATSSSGGGATATIPTTTTPKPAPAGLTDTQAYDVKLSITNSSGGLDTTDPLKRLSILPSPDRPLLVELGVLQGGDRVLFAVEPGAVVNGPGSCIPGPIDCEVLSLGQDQVEALAAKTSTGTQSVALFAVTGITAADQGSVAAADRARRASSDAGQKLLNASSSAALSLFRYAPGLGAIVDERTLGVS